MKVSQIFLRVYSVFMVIVLLVGLTLMDIVAYEEMGVKLCLGSVFLFVGYLVMIHYADLSREQESLQSVENPEIMPWGAFLYPWFLSFVISVGMDYFFIEKISSYVLLGSEIIISILLSYTLIRRIFPELLKYSRGLAVVVIAPVSSVVVALIFTQMLVTV